MTPALTSRTRLSRSALSSGTGILILIALARIVLHTFTDGRYGFHRDELATVDDAGRLAWGYVAYPPLTPFIARVSFELFGPSLVALRLFGAVAQGAALVLTGLMARELGGKRWAQAIAGAAVAVAPVALSEGLLFQYITFDYLWWVVIAYLMIRLLRSEEPRWWLGIGAAVGLGMMTKYTMLFLVAGIAGAVLVTEARRYLMSRWLWYGIALSLLIFLPNLIWQIQHQFISVEFLNNIHARDIRIGRTSGFLIEQLLVPANPFTVPLWIPGLYFYFLAPEGKRYRAMGWMFIIVLLLFFAARGRSYYMGPAYPVLFAAGAVVWERRLSASTRWARAGRAFHYAALAAGAVLAVAFLVPLTPVNSRWWQIANHVNSDWREEVGWQELVATVARIRDSLPAGERARASILAANYGEAGAIDLYGAAYGLPKAISGVNSYWARGYGDPPPENLIVVGLSRPYVERNFASCELAGHNTNRFGVKNEESSEHPDIFVCGPTRKPWREFWAKFRYYG